MSKTLMHGITSCQGSQDPQGGCGPVSAWLRRMNHDLASPLASFQLELASLRQMTVAAADQLRTGKTDGVADYLAEVLDIVENLEGALETATALTQESRALVAELAPDGGPR